jgi:hypothetical protein
MMWGRREVVVMRALRHEGGRPLQTGNPLASSRFLVKWRIIYTSYPDMLYLGNPHHALAGVASFWEALNGW